MVYIAFILYLLIIIILFLLIHKRTKHLSKRHFDNTGVEFLKWGYKITRKKVIILLIGLLFLISLLFLTFIENELLQKRLMHIDKKTLDDSDF